MPRQIHLRSLLATHDRPLVVIDREYRIVAVNQAFEESYKVSAEAIVGRPCYKVAHHNDAPCNELGDDCPYRQVYGGEGQVRPTGHCLHTHYDGHGRMRSVRVKVFPIHTADGDTLIGELIEDLAEPETDPVRDTSFVGRSQAFLQALDKLQCAARAQAPVLLQGETGTGKDMAAAFIHRHSARHQGPFIAVDCTALSGALFESEVFGHEKGAFTGSVGTRRGLFELADGGTLFLDEVGEIPLDVQVKFLRVLETGQFRRVGGHKTHAANVRIVCASNRPLSDSVGRGGFRADLYYRIACFTVEMPPLRQRLDDLTELADTLLGRVRAERGRPFAVAPDAMRFLEKYDFPGNVRELRNILEVAAAYCEGEEITLAQVQRAMPCPSCQSSVPPLTPDLEWLAGPLAAGETMVDSPPIRDLEVQYIRELLARYEGHRRRVAERMGISERTLYRKLKRYGID